jgi:hypothetical protein
VEIEIADKSTMPITASIKVKPAEAFELCDLRFENTLAANLNWHFIIKD